MPQLENSSPLLDDMEPANQLRAILDLSTDAIYIKDTESRYRLINPAGGQLFGLHPDEIIGKTDFDLRDAKFAQRMRDIDLRVMQQQVSYSHGESFEFANGRQIVHTTKMPYRAPNGQILGVIGISRDITDRKVMEDSLSESEERFYRLFEVSPDGILLLDPETSRILDCNPAACIMNGYSREELIGQSIDILNHSVLTPDEMMLMDASGFNVQRDIPNSETYVDLIRRKGFLKYVTFHRHKDGTAFPVEVSTILMSLAGREVLVGFDRDISERIAAEREHLEHQRLHTALEKEIELHELKTKMMERVSHEFRTPLTIINTSTDFLERYGDRLSDEQRIERLSMIRMQVSQLAKMLDDIAHVVQGELHQIVYKPESFDLNALCRSLVQHMQAGVGAAHIFEYSTISAPIIIEADEHLIRLILTNLLSNAVKYSPPGSVVTLDAYIEGEYIILRVHDEGIGIASQDYERIFEPFYRGRNFDERPGLGIGLTLVKNAVQAANGHITVNSCPDSGTCFTVHIPGTAHTSPQ